ncbi:MAG TPA: hypothetical protein VEJ87_15690 [Acidimicrobiales bacterium]|nr:hypothetical protein [Acidimicrobiales bacterium]
MGVILRLDPFQDSASEIVLSLVVDEPTVMQLSSDVQETLRSWPDVKPVGIGTGSAAQALPSQASPIGPTLDDPTARHVEEPGHETPYNEPLVGGALATDHDVPSQFSIRGLPSLFPTAVHAIAETHDTLES